MRDVDRFPIYSVAVDPQYCPQCGTELGARTFEEGEYTWCPNCEMSFGRVPVAAVHVIVLDGAEVLLLDEPIPQHEGVWSLPGGFAGYNETPREAAVRELGEETGLKADPDALTLLTVHHAETERMGFHFSTYTVSFEDTVGDLRPEGEDFQIEILPVKEVLAASDRLRDSDRERLNLAFDTVDE